MYNNKIIKYKTKYNKIIKDTVSSSYNNINNFLTNANKYYYEIKEHQRSKPKIISNIDGKMKNYSEYKSSQSGGEDYDRKIYKYKKFIKGAKKTIMYYKNIAEQYYTINQSLHFQYNKLFNILNTKRNELESTNISNIYNKNNLEILNKALTLLQNNMIDKVIDLDIVDDNKLSNIYLEESPTLSGGTKTIVDVKQLITDESKKIDDKIKNAIENNKWINTKTEALYKRLDNFVREKDNLQKISINIEWIIRELEKKGKKQDADYQDIYDIFKEEMDKLNKHDLNASEEIAKRLKDLEELAEKFNEFIVSNKKALDGLDEEKKTQMNKFEEELKTAIEKARKQSGGDNYKLKKTIGHVEDQDAGASNFEKLYIEEIKDEINNLNIYILHEETKPKLFDIEYIDPDNVQDMKILTQKKTIIELLYKLDLILQIYNKIIIPDFYYESYCKEIKRQWKTIFNEENENVITNFYNSTILNNIIYDITSKELKEISVKDFFNNIKSKFESVNIALSKFNEPNSFNYFNNLIIFIEHLTFVKINIFIGYYYYNYDEESIIFGKKMRDSLSFKNKSYIAYNNKKILSVSSEKPYLSLSEVKKKITDVTKKIKKEKINNDDINEFIKSINELIDNIKKSNDFIQILKTTTFEDPKNSSSTSMGGETVEKKEKSGLENDLIKQISDEVLNIDEKNRAKLNELNKQLSEKKSEEESEKKSEEESKIKKELDELKTQIEKDKNLKIIELQTTTTDNHISLVRDNIKKLNLSFNKIGKIMDELNKSNEITEIIKIIKNVDPVETSVNLDGSIVKVFNSSTPLLLYNDFGSNNIDNILIYKSKSIEPSEEPPEDFKNICIEFIDTSNFIFSKILYDTFTSDTNHTQNEYYKKILDGLKENITNITDSIKDLYDRIKKKLGKGNENDDLEELDKDINEIYEYINSTNSGGASSVTSTKIKPRLENIKNTLMALKEKIKKFLAIKDNIIKKINEINREKIDKNDIDKLLLIKYELNNNYNKGILNLTNSIPLVILTTEYNPNRYVNDKCKYKLTYNNKEDEIKYETQDDIKKYADDPRCNYEKTNFTYHAHNAFFNDNSKIKNKEIYIDPIIGIKKLIDNNNIDEKSENPINMVSSIIFTLGASGTGKTFRLFGKNDSPDLDEKNGIVQNIIREHKQVDISYFVCYGRKTNNTENDFSFNEMLIFFNYNEINKDKDKVKDMVEDKVKYDEKLNTNDSTNNFTQSNITEDHEDNNKYIIYIQDTTPAPASAPALRPYSDFYKKLIEKKLIKEEYSNYINYIQDGNDYKQPKNLKPEENKTFRELLQSDEIWTNIDGERCENYFKILLKEQKKIKTILPTKNNIESSRGHTCVIIRTKNNKKYNYNVIIDMAGTEDCKDMKSFLISDDKRNNKNHKIIKLVNQITQQEPITDESTSIDSLNSLFMVESIKDYLNPGNTFIGGDGNIKYILNHSRNVPGNVPMVNKFLYKIVNEGYYINHTIGTLIFIQKFNRDCLESESDLNSVNDKFEEINDDTNYFNKYLFNKDSDKKSQIFYNKFDYDTILETSCIWAQVLMSFLYWNRESENSMNKINEICNSFIYNGNQLFKEISMQKYIGKTTKIFDMELSFYSGINSLTQTNIINLIYKNDIDMKWFFHNYHFYGVNNILNGIFHTPNIITPYTINASFYFLNKIIDYIENFDNININITIKNLIKKNNSIIRNNNLKNNDTYIEKLNTNIKNINESDKQTKYKNNLYQHLLYDQKEFNDFVEEFYKINNDNKYYNDKDVDHQWLFLITFIFYLVFYNVYIETIFSMKKLFDGYSQFYKSKKKLLENPEFNNFKKKIDEKINEKLINNIENNEEYFEPSVAYEDNIVPNIYNSVIYDPKTNIIDTKNQTEYNIIINKFLTIDTNKISEKEKNNILLYKYVIDEMIFRVHITEKIIKDDYDDALIIKLQNEKESSIRNDHNYLILKDAALKEIEEIEKQTNISDNEKQTKISIIKKDIKNIDLNFVGQEIIKSIRNNEKNKELIAEYKEELKHIYSGSDIIAVNKYKLTIKNDEKKKIINKEHFFSNLKHVIDKGLNEDIVMNNINRIKDSRILPTKFIILLLVTGETYKTPLVKETTEIVDELYQLTNIEFKE